MRLLDKGLHESPRVGRIPNFWRVELQISRVHMVLLIGGDIRDDKLA